jgi:YHS domain-containing protein
MIALYFLFTISDRVTGMFEGNKECSICGKVLPDKEGSFGISLKGFTYGFCESCVKTKKDQVKKVLHDEK